MYYYPEQSSISEQSDAAVHSLGGQSFGRVELWVSMDCKKAKYWNFVTTVFYNVFNLSKCKK